jgi:hypothetical protein
VRQELEIDIMPQYALIGTHPPNVCPMSNKAAREIAKKAYEQLPSLCKKLNVKLLLDLHLDPNHKAFMLFEAPTAEAVRDLVTMAGFLYFLDFDFHLVTPISEVLKLADKMPTIY